jgi:predicted phage tail protein
MKLIQVTEAAERLGVSRQTLENWGKNGTLKIRTMGKTGNSHWVDADTIDALGDTIQDIENTRKRLQQEQEFIRADYRKESQLRKDIERELFMVGKFGTAVYCKEFYMSIPIMLNEIGLLNHRESQIMRAIINGNDLGWIAQDYGLTRSRITQIFYKGCRKARELSTIKAQLDELRELKNEMTQMKTELKIMNDELKVQRIAEQELQEMEEAERIKYIKETDEKLKLFNTRLVDCDLSVRALNCLKAADLETIGDLAKCTKCDLLKFRNFGKRSLGELDDFLDSKGLTFGTDVDKIYRDRIAQRLQELDKR